MLVLCRRFLLGPPRSTERSKERSTEHGSHEAPADLNARELGFLVPIVALMTLIGLFSPWFTDRIAPSVAGWLEHLK